MANGDLPGHDPRPLLRGWKEVATYFRVSVRTAQRLSELDGLPVCRTGHQKGGVWAYPAELDAWVKRQDGLAPATHDAATVALEPEGNKASHRGALTEGASDGIEHVDEPESQVAGVIDGTPGWFTRPRVVLGSLGAMVAVVTLVAFIVSGAAPFDGSAADGPGSTATPSSRATQHGGAARDLRIRVRFGEHPAADLQIREGKRSLVLQTATQQALFLEPALRGQSLHVVLYERASGQADDAPFDVIGTADLIQSTEPEALPVRFMVDGVWLELEWVR